MPRERSVGKALALNLLAEQIALQLATPVRPLHYRAIVRRIDGLVLNTND